MNLHDVLNGFGAAPAVAPGGMPVVEGDGASPSSSDFESLITQALEGSEDVLPGEHAEDDELDGGPDLALLLAMSGAASLPMVLQNAAAQAPLGNLANEEGASSASQPATLNVAGAGLPVATVGPPVQVTGATPTESKAAASAAPDDGSTAAAVVATGEQASPVMPPRREAGPADPAASATVSAATASAAMASSELIAQPRNGAKPHETISSYAKRPPTSPQAPRETSMAESGAALQASDGTVPNAAPPPPVLSDEAQALVAMVSSPSAPGRGVDAKAPLATVTVTSDTSKSAVDPAVANVPAVTANAPDAIPTPAVAAGPAAAGDATAAVVQVIQTRVAVPSPARTPESAKDGGVQASEAGVVQDAAAIAAPAASSRPFEGAARESGGGRSDDRRLATDVKLTVDMSGPDGKATGFAVAHAALETGAAPGTATIESPPHGSTSTISLRDTESNLQTIVRAVRMHWTADGGEARLRLDPEHLGQVTLTVRVERGSVTAHIQAETAEASQWIETHQQDLRSSLREQGLEVKDVVVTTNPDGRRQQDRQARPPRPRPSRPGSADTAPTFEVLA